MAMNNYYTAMQVKKMPDQWIKFYKKRKPFKAVLYTQRGPVEVYRTLIYSEAEQCWIDHIDEFKNVGTKQRFEWGTCPASTLLLKEVWGEEFKLLDPPQV